jgi:tetratricopeptide (TPR) repeat protein
MRYSTRPLLGTWSRMMSVATFAILFIFLSDDRLSASDSGERQRSFVHAQEQFDKAQNPQDYRAAAKEFEKVLSDGFQNGIVYYNLGNAYYRAGDYGQAILNYRKAKSLRPRDVYLDANLQQALAAAPGRLTQPTAPWWTHVLFWNQWFSFPIKVKLTAGCLMTAAVVWVISIVRRHSRLHGVTGALLCLGLALAIDLMLSNPQSVTRAVIIAETVARKGTADDYEPAFSQPLRDGAEFTILSETSDWTLGQFEGIGNGWIRNQFIAK